MKFLSALLAIILAWLVYAYLHRPIIYPPGILIAAEPEQTALPDSAAPIRHGPFQLKPLARFALDARLLHRKIYRYDRESALAPVDLAVGWGPMSNQSVLDRLKITQSMRFFWYEYQLPPPIPPEQIVSHGTNLHIIPSTSELESRCKSLRSGTLIHLSGKLVEATGPEIGGWRSSLSRTDTGKGACELIWLEELRLIPPNKLSLQDRLVRR